VTESDVVVLLDSILNSTLSSQITKEYALTAVMKLTTRFTTCNDQSGPPRAHAVDKYRANGRFRKRWHLYRYGSQWRCFYLRTGADGESAFIGWPKGIWFVIWSTWWWVTVCTTFYSAGCWYFCIFRWPDGFAGRSGHECRKYTSTSNYATTTYVCDFIFALDSVNIKI